jgi:hypothetical protein
VAQSKSIEAGRVRVGRPVAAANGRSRFGLTGVSQAYDPRTVAIRPDLADIAVAGQHFAPHYSAPMMRSITRATPLLSTPAMDSEVLAPMLPGEGFALLDLTGGMAWGYRLADHRVGYCRANCLGSPIAPTHRVIRADAGLFSVADANSAAVTSLPAGSLVMGWVSGDWLETPHGWMQLADMEEMPATSAGS